VPRCSNTRADGIYCTILTDVDVGRTKHHVQGRRPRDTTLLQFLDGSQCEACRSNRQECHVRGGEGTLEGDGIDVRHTLGNRCGNTCRRQCRRDARGHIRRKADSRRRRRAHRNGERISRGDVVQVEPLNVISVDGQRRNKENTS
jgi:hypothetical protein